MKELTDQLAIAAAFLVPLVTPVLAVTLAWDAIDEPRTGFKLHWGPASGSPTQHLEVGNVFQATIDNFELPMGSTIYFTATAYNQFGESGPSNEVAYDVPIATSIAEFVKIDQSTQGNWKGAYGQDGYAIAADAVNYPAGVAVTVKGNSNWIWTGNTSDERALQKAGHETERIAACWHQATSFTIDVTSVDGLEHIIALYCLDWDQKGRMQNIRIVDADTEAILDTRNVSAFQSGKYLIYKVKGHFKIIVIRLAGPNAVISGIFFGTGIAAPTNLRVP